MTEITQWCFLRDNGTWEETVIWVVTGRVFRAAGREEGDHINRVMINLAPSSDSNTSRTPKIAVAEARICEIIVRIVDGVGRKKGLLQGGPKTLKSSRAQQRTPRIAKG